jgi:beta-phosphoglucomutase
MITAIIFDMDGVLCKTEEARFIFFKKIFKKNGIIIKNSLITKVIGIRTLKAIEILAEGKLNSKEIQNIYNIKKQDFIKNINEWIIPQEGLYELLDSTKKFKLILATASPKDYSDNVINFLKIKKYFDFIFSATHVKNVKPDPEIYNIVKRKLNDKFNIKENEIIVIEDSSTGVLSAKSAGLKCIGLASYNNESELKDANADYVFKSLTEIKKFIKNYNQN